jgi:hypothetical protein
MRFKREPVVDVVSHGCVEGKDEDLVFEAAAQESMGTVCRRLDWPMALDGDVDCTLLSNHRGVLMPRNWSKPYFPIRYD